MFYMLLIGWFVLIVRFFFWLIVAAGRLAFMAACLAGKLLVWLLVGAAAAVGFIIGVVRSKGAPAK